MERSGIGTDGSNTGAVGTYVLGSVIRVSIQNQELRSPQK